MGWLQDRWGQGGPFGWAGKTFERNRGFIGPYTKIMADVVAPFSGPFAPLVAGAGNALGSAITPGTNFGDIAKSGVTGAAIGELGYGLGQAFGAGSGAGAAAGTAGGNTGAAIDAGLETAGTSAAGTAATQAAKTLSRNAPSSLAERVWGAVKDVGSWAGRHPETIAQGFNAISQAPMNEAYARRMALLNQQSEYEQERQKARDQALNPIWQALAGQARGYMNRQPNAIARNPYSSP